MAGVEGMDFSAGGLSLENKGSDALYWQDPMDPEDDVGSADLFDQFVVLDGADSTAGEGFGQLYGATDMPISPHALAADAAPPALPTSGSSSSLHTASTAKFPPPQQYRHSRGAPPMTDLTDHPAGNPRQRDDGLFARHEVPGGGSISDSELLKLEGLTMRSPRVQVPPASASVPASPPTRSTSPRKANRLETLYTRIRDNFQGKPRPQQQQQQPLTQPPVLVPAPAMSTIKMESAGMGSRPRPFNPHLSETHMPLSPPLTGPLSDTSQQPLGTGSSSNSMGYINNYLDNPFFETPGLPFENTTGIDPHSVPIQPPQGISRAAIPSTPLQTPHLANFPLANNAAQSATWQFDASANNNPNASKMGWPSSSAAVSSSSFVTPGGQDTNRWWDAGDAMDTDAVSYQTAESRQAAFNLALQGFQFPQLPMHMPQPRSPTGPAVLHRNHGELPSAAPHQFHLDIINGHDQHHHPHHAGNAFRRTRSEQQLYQPPPPPSQQQRRPKPKAPSSGARHQPPAHQRHASGSGSGALTSPRKARTASGGSTSSPSPTPGRLQRRSASMQMLRSTPAAGSALDGGPSSPAAVRKRRSWTGRRGNVNGNANAAANASATDLNRAALAAAELNFDAMDSPHYARKPSSSAATGSSRRGSANSSASHHHNQQASDGGGGGGGRGGSSAFVNYTPSDHNLLMTGVAPSGSSKTKARRDREAQEKQRKLRETIQKAIAAAGGDARKLEDGILLDV
ncbi:hypothetical protein B0T24DRAFT_257985 [Lasiosphaeria ovina]|uniref:Developmental regulatory protein wetA n=1 Tax=Lasiosphaeria ovina TaxID=92902 RepID=A0AAE0N7Q2_9PEZI|nr:hypothetical protein B0T24DRAFT_257985 [Lasiosphaeria ovina]